MPVPKKDMKIKTACYVRMGNGFFGARQNCCYESSLRRTLVLFDSLFSNTQSYPGAKYESGIGANIFYKVLFKPAEARLF